MAAAGAGQTGDGDRDFLRGTRYYVLVLMKRQAGPAPTRRRGSHPEERSLRRSTMNKRLVWLAPIALAVLLSGCRFTLQVTDVAPSSLLGNSLKFTNSKQSVLFPDGHGTFHFNSQGMAFDENLIPARTWSYKREGHRNATLALTFASPGTTDLMVNCDLTFTSQHTGNHKCDYAHRTSTMMVDVIVRASSEGTFELEEL